jgi:hypothetical protein
VNPRLVSFKLLGLLAAASLVIGVSALSLMLE